MFDLDFVFYWNSAYKDFISLTYEYGFRGCFHCDENVYFVCFM